MFSKANDSMISGVITPKAKLLRINKFFLIKVEVDSFINQLFKDFANYRARKLAYSYDDQFYYPFYVGD